MYQDALGRRIVQNCCYSVEMDFPARRFSPGSGFELGLVGSYGLYLIPARDSDYVEVRRSPNQ
jgi:hypothetical protein